MSDPIVKTSKFLSLILRHNPGKIGLVLDSEGWAEVDELLAKMAAHGKSVSRKFLDEVVETNNKKRFAYSDDGRQIRASQGHSISVDLALEPVQPPPVLFHGTVERFLASIEREGLIPGSRQHVHLSADAETATIVGKRRGRPIILMVDAAAMVQAGYRFYLSANEVWLTDRVPPEFVSRSE